MRVAKLLAGSVRCWAALLTIAALIVMFVPRQADASNCFPCDQFHCPGPGGGCMYVGTFVCQGGGPSGPGALLYCHDKDCIECCPYLIYWGQC
jgi:hypothetical protein